MFRHVEPVYRENMIMTARIMQEHAEFGVDFAENMYADYSDGIISGVEIEISDVFLFIQPGIIKYKQKIYVLNKKVAIPYEHNEQLTFLRVRFLTPIEEQNGIVYESEVILTQEQEEFPYEMELGRFIATKGARLCNLIGSYEDLAVKYDRFDRRYVKYAAVGEPTIAPYITKAFAEALLNKKMNDVFDVAFAMQCLGGKPIAREVINAYIFSKTNKKISRMTNEEIYIAFDNILKQPTVSNRMNHKNTETRRLIVD